MTKKRKALKMALEALKAAEELAAKHDGALEHGFKYAITKILEALAQPEKATEKEKISRSMTAEIVDSRESAQPTEQVSVARIGMIGEDHFSDVCSKAGGNSNTPLYAAPPKREWVELTPADFEKLEQLYGHQVSNDFAFANIVCQIEAKLKELNHD